MSPSLDILLETPGVLFELCHQVTRSGPIFPGMRATILKITGSHDCLIFIAGIPILVRRHICIESASWSLIELMPTFLSSTNFTHHLPIRVDGYGTKRCRSYFVYHNAWALPQLPFICIFNGVEGTYLCFDSIGLGDPLSKIYPCRPRSRS